MPPDVAGNSLIPTWSYPQAAATSINPGGVSSSAVSAARENDGTIQTQAMRASSAKIL